MAVNAGMVSLMELVGLSGPKDIFDHTVIARIEHTIPIINKRIPQIITF